MKQVLLLITLITLGASAGYAQEIEVITQEKIQGVITLITYSPDGTLIASGSAKENSVKVWDVMSGKIIGKLEGHNAATTAIGFNMDGTVLYTSAKDEMLMVWDIVNWKLIDSVNIKEPMADFVNSPTDPNLFYAAGMGGKVYKWKLNDIQHPEVLFKDEMPFTRIDVSAKHLVAGTAGGKVILFNLSTNVIEKNEKIHVAAVKGLKFYNDGQNLITTGGGGLVHLWDINDLTQSKHFTASATPLVAFDANVAKNRFVTASQNKEIKVWDLMGNLIFEFKGRIDENESSEVVNAITISPDGSTVASTGFRRTQSQKSRTNDNVIRVWDMNRGTHLKTLGGQVNPIYTFDFHPVNNEVVTLGEDRTLTFWDFNLAEKFGTFQLIEPKREIPPRRKNLSSLTANPLDKFNRIRNGNIVGDITGGIKNTTKEVGTAVVKRSFGDREIVKFSSKGNFLITKLNGDEIRLYEMKNRKPEYKCPLWSYQMNINQILTSPDEKYCAVLGSGDTAISIISLETFEFVDKLPTPAPTAGNLRFVFEANSLAFSPDGKFLAVCFNTSKTYVYEVETWQLVFENILPDNLGYSRGAFVNFSSDGKYMIVNSMFGVKRYDTSKFGELQNDKLKIDGHSVPLDKPSDYAITIADEHIWFENLMTGETVKGMRADHKQITHISVSPGGKIGITFRSGQFMIIDPSTGKEDLLMVADGDNYIMKTHENFYKVSKEGYELVTFRIGNRAYPFEQFDAVFNRPDLVLKKMNCTDTALMELYEMAYQKRIKKLGLQPTTTVSLTDIPTTKITNTAGIPAVTDKSTVTVNLQMADNKGLISYNVWVNNVPVYGKKGKPITSKSSLTITEEVPLIFGLNKVQIASRNSAGYESLMQTFYVEKTGEQPKRDLYLITIGTSEYKDSRYNLNYAVKDAQDLVTLLSENANGVYNSVKSKSLLNQDVTSTNVEALKTFLSTSKPDDVVMVFVAGHGVLDNNFDYYFGTYDMDFSNPSVKGLAYEKLEGILDGIKANKKILIMDTCHSGEVDKEDVFFVETTEEQESNEDVSFRSVGDAVMTKETGATPSRLAGELFNDLRRGTGSTVISSAGGAEFAMESDEWRNGLFTYCLLNGLQSRTADLNGDGSIMLLELQEYVVSKVTSLSNGKQIPNTRMQNLELDFRFW
ncbi:MAG: caspase family protein [Crocinitomicaceae bacterium]|nr:caspase family protein [Crocinitomicaceae bacterium]MBK8927048.1 caspase family protein [Crocinitomicaceae bacterium]